MSIQSNINGILGTAAGAATASKYARNQETSNELAGMQAVEQAKKDMQPIIEENAKATEDYAKASDKLKALNKTQRILKGLENGTAPRTEETAE